MSWRRAAAADRSTSESHAAQDGWIPGQRILIAGDVLFDDLHVYTAETDANEEI
jgi:hypothetical protein